ncbi:unnamed protein product [Medioppia subpectinata]|uniref:Uncharacterized protein n=1 Tax=Medioppia subpectinata TaxID=1979941 RepID=A0A7R9KK50_9ACAR|nr:unnamed protein product [Medioppia subpectinata]CAG2105186.1 unnamed protein product [Medioppia subpectinata]
MASSLYNHYLMKILSKEKNNPHLYNDFAYLMSSCGQLVSADVPSALRQLAQAIENPQEFRALSDEKALEYLKHNSNQSGQQFRAFIAEHGHRGYKEFEPLCKPWKYNAIPLIQSLKTMLTGDASTYKTTEKVSVTKIVDSLKTPLSFQRKFLLKQIVLPLARRAVAMRESTKSAMIYGWDLSRLRDTRNRLSYVRLPE